MKNTPISLDRSASWQSYIRLRVPHGFVREGRGFTLIELLTVIAIIGILAAILIPVVGSVRDSAKTAQASSNVRQIGSLNHIYMDEHEGRLPTDLWGLGGTDPWLIALWKISEDQDFPEFGAAASGQKFRDSVFYTPHLRDVAEDGKPPRSFGWSVDLRLNDPGSGAGGARFAAFQDPSKTACLADTTSSSALGSGARREQVNFRNNGKALFLFLDAHVELLSPTQVPSNREHILWGGTETEITRPGGPTR